MATTSAAMRTVSCLTIRLLPLIVGIIFTSQTSCTYAAQTFIGVSTNWALLKGEERSTGYHVMEMTSDKDLKPALSVKSMNMYFTNSSFGYFIESGIESYSLHRNVYPGSVAVKTRLEGQYLYLTPTAFYDFIKGNPGHESFKIGVGLGIGYLTADGKVMINGPEIDIRTIDGKNFGTSIGLILEYTYENWVFIAKEYTPGATIDGIDFIIELPTFMVGYRF